MFIDGKQTLSNPGVHGPTEKCVTVEVTKVAYFLGRIRFLPSSAVEMKKISCQ
jgi:hypothetical protein